MSSFLAKLSLGLCLLGSASAAAIEQPVQPRATTTTPPSFPYILGPVQTVSPVEGVCTASVKANYNLSFWDCGRHTYLTTVTSTYSVDCGACNTLTANYVFPAGGCPMGPTYTVTTVSTPYTYWDIGCAKETPAPAPTSSAAAADVTNYVTVTKTVTY